jgi:hypothetical protein
MRFSLRIETYFRQINETIENCAFVQTFNVTYDKRGTHEGFIRGEIYFRDGSRLQFREFVDIELTTDRLMYSYHYTDTSGQFVFRYDNTGHHKNLNLSTHPHHKHDGNEQNVVISAAPDFVAALDEIEKLIQLP